MRSQAPKDSEFTFKKARNHKLAEDKVAFRLRVWHETGRFVSPYCRGVRTAHLEALVELGINEAWSDASCMKKVKEILERVTIGGVTAWDRWLSRSPTTATGPALLERVFDNYKSFRKLCCRGGTNPYGWKLLQMGCCVDFFRDEQSVRYIRLNQYSIRPVSLRVVSKLDIPPVDRTGHTLGPQWSGPS